MLRGTIELPAYLDASFVATNRDPETGALATARTAAVPFVMRIPTAPGVPLGDFRLADGLVMLDVLPVLQLWAGRMLPPSDRLTLASADTKRGGGRLPRGCRWWLRSGNARSYSARTGPAKELCRSLRSRAAGIS